MTARYALLHEIPGQLRARLRLWGPDTRRFLQGTLTADLEALRSDHAVAAGLCTVKGKLRAELVLLAGEGDDEVIVLVPSDAAQEVASHFERHIIMDEVEVEAQGPTGVAVLWGEGDEVPAAPSGLRSAITRHPAPGRLCEGDPAALALALRGGEAVDANGWAARRIATASPGWGHELRPDFFPPEVGFVYAVSYDKGCFLGQEPLARIHARGQVNRVMVRVRLAAAPSQGGELGLSAEGREDAGRLTTWASTDDGVIGLAIVRREVARVGARLRTRDEAEQEVEVTSGALGDDPGLGGHGKAATVKLGGRR